MRLLAVLLLFAASLACQALPVRAEARLPSTEAPFVPRFAPPLGTPLRYRLTKERVTPAASERSVFEELVLFERAGDGFAMRITWLRIIVGGRTYDPVKDLQRFPAEARPMFLPMTMELDRDGRPLRMRDWPQLRAMLLGFVPVMARGTETDPAKRQAMERFYRSFMQRYTALSAEEAVNHMVQGWPPVLAELGSEVELGREVRTTMQAPTPFTARPIDYDTTASWTLAKDGKTLHLARRSIPSAEGLRAAGTGLADAAKQIGTPKGEADMRSAFADMKMTMQTEIDFDRASGLPRKAVIEKIVVTNGQSGTDRITIEAL